MISFAQRAVAAGVMAALILLSGACSGPTAPAPSPTGEGGSLISVDGRKIFLECRGSGTPTVILLSGFGDAADIWQYSATDPTPVVTSVAASARVCAYDRPGSVRILDDGGVEASTPLPGRSDPVPMPRTGSDVVDELRALLVAAQLPGPYVLVGHSLGGLLGIHYARTFPTEVAGLVLVDALLPTIRNSLSASQWEKYFRLPLGKPEQRIAGYTGEAYDLDKTLAQIEDTRDLPPVRVSILVRDASGPGTSSEDRALDELWRRAQQKVAAELPQARLTVVPRASHYIQVDAPSAVVDAVREVSA